MHWAKRLAWTFGRTAFLFIFASLLASISVFNSDENFSSFSRDIFYRTFAPFYRGSADRAATVVLLNDASFRSFDTYPVKYGTHAQILRVLATYSPSAVFIDFAFIDRRTDTTLDELKRVLEEYRKRNIRVYVPVHKVGNDPNDRGIRPELATLADEGAIHLVSFELGRTLWGVPVYPLSSRDGKHLTVSAQIARDLFPHLYDNIKNRSEFEIWWALPPAPINCMRANAPCPWDYSSFDHICCSTYSLVQRLWSSIDLQLAPFAKASKPDSVDLPYSPIVYVEDLLKSGDNREHLKKVLDNKLIFYGGDFDVVRDNFPNPIFSYRSHDRVILGVFFHAMAMENIRDLQENIKAPRRSDPPVMWGRDVVSIGLICLALFVWRALTPWNSRLLDVGIIVVASVAIAYVEFFFLNNAPSNWIGVFSFLTLARVVRADEWFDKTWRWFKLKVGIP